MFIAYSNEAYKPKLFLISSLLGGAKVPFKSEHVVFMILQYMEAQWNVGRLLTTVILQKGCGDMPLK